MCLDAKDAEKGDIVSLMITGMIGKYLGKVIDFDDLGYPIIKVEEVGPFSRLKWGDYVLIEREARGY